ncbi:hypothetical protein QQZ08_006888 [Neonectria magnoliae]|uniref:Uncharacterized protein n=1 Tax=Neonectria magnoliae TaxID=2732573 RepID=A0ABR1I0T6_9HYPO
MKRVDLDIESKTVALQGGALWGHAYKELVNDHYDGYIINGVEMKMRVQELQWKDVVARRFTWSPSSDAETMLTFMETMNTFYTTDWPDRITIDSSWLCNSSRKGPNPQSGSLTTTMGELAKQLKRRSMEEKSTRFLHETLVTQWSEKTTKAFPSNPSYSIYTSFVSENKESKIREITAIIRDEMCAFRELFDGEQGLLQVTWIHSGGQASRKRSDASAFRWRDCVYHAYIMIQWQEKWLKRDMREFLQRFNEALRKYSMAGRAAFINFPDEALVSEAHEMAYFGHNRLELRGIKKI